MEIRSNKIKTLHHLIENLYVQQINHLEILCFMVLLNFSNADVLYTIRKGFYVNYKLPLSVLLSNCIGSPTHNCILLTVIYQFQTGMINYINLCFIKK